MISSDEDPKNIKFYQSSTLFSLERFPLENVLTKPLRKQGLLPWPLGGKNKIKMELKLALGGFSFSYT